MPNEPTSEITLTDKRSAALEQVQPASDALLGLIEKLSSNQSLDVAKAEKLVELYLSGQRRMQEMQDEREYYERMAEFKRNPPEVIKRLTAKIKGQSKSGNDYQYDVPYADLNAFADAAMADLANRGITWDFEIVEEPKQMRVTCLLHYGLYTRRGSPATGDPALLQSPNPFMQKGAAQSFLMRYSFCASTGLTAALPGDKNGTTLTPAPAIAREDEAKLQEWHDSLRQAPDLPSLKNVFADAYKFSKLVSEDARKEMQTLYNECKVKLQ